MSISSIADESALRLTASRAATPQVAKAVAAAAAAAAGAAAGGAAQDVAIQKGHDAAASATQDDGQASSTSSGPLAQLVKYIPTETITLYIAILAALGDISAPKNGKLSDADFSSRWAWMWIMVVVTLALTLGLSYRSQKDATKGAALKFKLPYFDVLAAGVAFVVWALSLPSTPLRDISGYNYSAWNSVIILAGTVIIATTAYVLGKTVSWHKVVDE